MSQSTTAYLTEKCEVRNRDVAGGRAVYARELIEPGELIAVWSDPDFDPTERAFYYTRVIEIPTPRWTAYDAKRFGVTPSPGTRMTVTERAYASPIWYTPEN